MFCKKSTHSRQADDHSATSPKGIKPTLGFGNGQGYNLIRIQHCETSHQLRNALVCHCF
uniref:Uncharacterized protein n=1 Tax=Rhizophora mucronata TaxID=61149 RepID=A0A2P2Q8T9_RHIMU